MVMCPYILDGDDDYEAMSDFFLALKGGNPEIENTSMSYTHNFKVYEFSLKSGISQSMSNAQHLKVFELPHFSDEEFHMEEFKINELNRTNLTTFITNNILGRFSEKDHVQLQIPVEHFSVEFLSQRLHHKMEAFWEGEALEPYELTEYDLSKTLT